MPNLATWIRPKDDKFFQPIFDRYPDVRVRNALNEKVSMDDANGLLLSGGSDIAPEFLRQEVPDPTILDKDVDPVRDRWELDAVKSAISRGLPIFAICRGLQVLNVALGGTLKLDIPGHKLPEMRDHDVQPLRHDRAVSYKFERVNSSHHQAIDRLAEGWTVESWCATDDIIEQIRLRGHPFALAVQYHPERGKIYDSLFEDFFDRINKIH